MRWDYICNVYLDHSFTQETALLLLNNGYRLGFNFFDPLDSSQRPFAEREIVAHIQLIKDFSETPCIFFVKYQQLFFFIKVSKCDINILPYIEKNCDEKIDLGPYMETLLRFCEDFPIYQIKSLPWISRENFMVDYVFMKKIRIIDENSAFYEFKVPDQYVYYLSINKFTKILEITDLEFSYPPIDFNQDQKIHLYWLKQKFAYGIAAKVKEVMNSGIFPDDISFRA